MNILKYRENIELEIAMINNKLAHHKKKMAVHKFLNLSLKYTLTTSTTAAINIFFCLIDC